LDLACSRCGYLLRGLARSGDCPECGLSIEEAFLSRSRAARRWAGAVAAGAYAVALLHVAVVGWYLYRRSLGWTALGPDVTLLVIAVAHAAAMWLVAWPEPLAPGAADLQRRRVRAWVRALSIAAPLAAGLALASELVAYRRHPALAAAARAAAAVIPLTAFFQYDYLMYLAPRAGDRWAAFVFRVARSAATAWLALAGLLALRNGAVVSEMASVAVSALFGYRCVGLAGYLVVCFYIVRLGGRFHRRLKSVNTAAD
jgi:hypothetical protein